ncbi:MAG: hypothetical protein U0892_09920 [Pirellulales bacterium]
MDPVKRKVLSELFLAPSVVLPIVGGLSAGMLSWACGGINSLSGAAAVCLLGGIGWMLTRIVFKIEDITEEALAVQLAEAARREKQELDRFSQELRRDLDHRTQDYLTLLRSLREEFREAANEPGVELRSRETSEQVDQVFRASVERLRESLRQWDLAQSLAGVERKKVLAGREHILKEISETIDHLRSVVGHFKHITSEENQSDLASLREELEASLRAAQRTEARLKELESKPLSSDEVDSADRE